MGHFLILQLKFCDDFLPITILWPGWLTSYHKWLSFSFILPPSLSDFCYPILFFWVLSSLQIQLLLSFTEVLHPRSAHLFTSASDLCEFLKAQRSCSLWTFWTGFLVVVCFYRTFQKRPVSLGCPICPVESPLAICFLTSHCLLAWVLCSCVFISHVSDRRQGSCVLLILLDTSSICPVFWSIIKVAQSLYSSVNICTAHRESLTAKEASEQCWESWSINMPYYNFVQVPLTKDDCLLMINQSEASSGYKINKASQLAPLRSSHHSYVVPSPVLNPSRALSPITFTTTLGMGGEAYQ